MNEKIGPIFRDFFSKIIAEQKGLDAETTEGMFEKLAFTEHVYRYWLIQPLYRGGYTNIEFEKVYREHVVGRGRKPACDVVAGGGDTLWIELKFAYSNTGYSFDELVRDFDRLNNLKDDKISRVYCIISIMENETPPKIFLDMDKHILENGNGVKCNEFKDLIGKSKQEWLRVMVYSW